MSGFHVVNVLGRLLHIANSYPGAVDKIRFYAMKERILERFGTRDGFDVQHIPGKECYTCYGTGIYHGIHSYSGDEWTDTCRRCWGDGWYKSPVWVTLERFRLGRYVFHCPRERTTTKPEPDVTRITGYVTHPDYGYRKPELAAIVLGLMFDWRLAWIGISDRWNRLWVVRAVSRRCIHCKRRTWSARKWKCTPCELLERAGRITDDVPF